MAAIHGHSHAHSDDEGNTSLRAILLVFALSLHSLFEGIALGLQDTTGDIVSLFIAIIIHKSIIGFSMGVRLAKSQLRTLVVIVCDGIFSFMSPLGAAAGIITSSQLSGPAGNIANGVLQSVACGTFLYVTFFEVIPHELRSNEKIVLKVFAVILGFGVVTILMFFS